MHRAALLFKKMAGFFQLYQQPMIAGILFTTLESQVAVLQKEAGDRRI